MNKEEYHNKAKIRIGFEALRKFLHLPDDAKILGVEMSMDDQLAERLIIYVEHPDLPRMCTGEKLPFTYPFNFSWDTGASWQ